jgi:hypothetical protein
MGYVPAGREQKRQERTGERRKSRMTMRTRARRRREQMPCYEQ